MYTFIALYTKIKKSEKLSDFPPNRPQALATTKKKVRHKVGIKGIKFIYFVCFIVCIDIICIIAMCSVSCYRTKEVI